VLTIRLTAARTAADLLAVPVTDGGAAELPGLVGDARAEAEALLGGATEPGRAGAVHDLPRPLRRPGRLLLVGVGTGDEAGWRAAGAAVARAAQAASVTVAMPSGAPGAAVRGLAEGLWLAAYRFVAEPVRGGRSAEGSTPRRSAEGSAPRRVAIAVDDTERYAGPLAAARATAEATAFARDLTNTPSSRKNPAWFAGQVERAAADRRAVRVTVRGPDRLAAEGFGGILAVGGGSASPPRLVEVAYRPRGARTHVALVGKGITFDSGGVSIKPVAAMKLMRKDMGGAASVIAATLGAAALGLPVRVTTLAPLAENMVSGSAYRPGDVIRHYDGTTSESTNTDAEGRLVLADALGYAVRRVRPDVLVDLATLTGANAVALGKGTAALYTESDELADAFAGAAAEAGERLWRMPLPTDYVEYLGSDIADLHSSPNQGAGSVVAALYLREFTGSLRSNWAHVDMSAPSWVDAAEGELAYGATGWGVRTLLRWLTTLSQSGDLTENTRG
jgi:leucyl aminopeptidase